MKMTREQAKPCKTHYDPPMAVLSMKSNGSREHRSTLENTFSGRPFHHQLHRLLNEGSSNQASESSGSDGDEGSRGAMSTRCKGNQILGVRRHCSSVPTSPATRRYHVSHFSCIPKSPRGPPGPEALGETSAYPLHRIGGI